MCGIAGILSFSNPIENSSLLGNLQSMTAQMELRGPDDEGIWIDPNGKLGLGFRRLSILDLTQGGHQPMISASGRSVIVLNGEIYNFKILRQQLETLGYRFRSQTDTEVLLTALEIWGTEAIPRLDGMFAFAWYELTTRTLLMARDRVGIKPLYYYQSDDRLFFASEVKSIRAALGHSTLLFDNSRLHDLFTLGYSYGSTTPFLGVRSLEPGCVLRIDPTSQKVVLSRFHDLLENVNETQWRENDHQTVESVEHELEQALLRSVEAHLVSDAPVGVVCSGGVDSSLIAGIAKKVIPDIKLFHAAIPGPGGELGYAQRVARHLNVPLRVAEIDAKSFLWHWPLVIYHNDFPSYHPNDVPLYLVCKLAGDLGYKVLLSGEGADELFGGYQVNLELSMRNRWRKIIGPLSRRFGRSMNSLAEALISDLTAQGLFARLSDSSGIASVGRVRRMMRSELLMQGNGERIQRGLEIQRRLDFLPREETAAFGYLLDRLYGHLGSLLLRNDRMGMMASIETRIPYLSNELLRTWIPMPLRFKIKPGDQKGLKYLLKRIAARWIPADIIYRPKLGFPVPLKRFVKPNPDIFKSGFLVQSIGLDPEIAQMLCQDLDLYYQFSSIELWGRIFFFGESPQDWSEWLVERCLPAI